MLVHGKNIFPQREKDIEKENRCMIKMVRFMISIEKKKQQKNSEALANATAYKLKIGYFVRL